MQRTILADKLRERAEESCIELTLVKDDLQITTSALWNLSTTGLQVISRYVIDATGHKSLIGRSQGARRQIFDNLFCLSFPIDTTFIGTWTESTPDGWWNVSADGQSGTASFYSISRVIRAARNGIAFYWSRTRHLKQMFELQEESNMCLRACHSSHLVPSGGAGWLAVGDATWTVQPLASGGIAKALIDAMCILRYLDDPLSYDAHQRKAFEAYSQELAFQYSAEGRWKNESFWSQCNAVLQSSVE